MRSARARHALALLVWLALPGCECDAEAPAATEDREDGDRAPDPDATLGLPPDVAARRVAVVEGEEITVLDVAYELEGLGSIGSARAADATRRRALVEAMVLEAALAAEARDRGLDESPRVSRERDELAMRALVAQVAGEVAPPTEEQLRAYFEAHRDRYRMPELRSASLIFTRDRDAAVAAIAEISGNVRRQSELWMSTAERIGFAGPRRQARIETELFAAVPREGEPYVPQLVRDAAFATEPATLYPEPVPVEDGWYIVRVMERSEPMDQRFETVREPIRRLLHDEAVDAYVTSLVAGPLSEASFDEGALDAVQIPVEPAPGESAPTVR